MSDFKSCKQCGELKPIGAFRKYYGGRKGTYTVCMVCERINSRHKYLLGKSRPSDEESQELAAIEELYHRQRAAGLQPPRLSSGRRTTILATVEAQLQKYPTNTLIPPQFTAAPPELQKWLTEELTEEPEYYLEDVYEALKTKYRPILRIDADTLIPVFDDTYQEILGNILARFDDYEDEYYSGN